MRRLSARSRKQRISLVVILLGLAMLMSLQAREPSWGPERVRLFVFRIFSPVQLVAARAFAPLTDRVRLILSCPRLTRENRELTKRVAELERVKSSNRELQKENSRLASLWALESQWREPGQLARVVGRELRRPHGLITLDRGGDSNVQQDSPVVTLPGLVVGRVVAVADSTCQVMLITASGSSLAVGLDEEGTQGLVTGRGQEQCMLEFILGKGKVTAGVELTTSGKERHYPRGLTVGRIVRVSRSSEGLKEVYVEPSASLSYLNEVMILPPLLRTSHPTNTDVGARE